MERMRHSSHMGVSFCRSGFSGCFFFDVMMAANIFIKLKENPLSESFFALPEASRCAL